MRYPVAAPVLFRWKDAEGNERKGKGTSRDISETGAFVLTRVSPPRGADIELRISFVSLPNATTAVRMKLGGQVLRVEQTTAGKGLGGFAVLTREVIFRESDERTGEGSPGANDAT
jgi:hypothetical protein